MHVGIVGAGIIGVASAVRLQDAYPELDITLISDKFTPNTTGDGVAGLWEPIYLGNKNDYSKVRKWGKETYNYMKDLWKSPEAGELGVCLVSSVLVSTMEEEDPFWKDIVAHYRRMSDEELKQYEKDEKLRFGMEYITFTLQPILYLPHLMRRFTRRGGKLHERKVTTLYELSDRFDVVVNCSGLGARTIAQDEKVHPIRGQVMRVAAPTVKMCFCLERDGPPNYSLINRDSIVLGGTTQHNNWSTEVNEDDEKHIREGFNKLMPQFKSAKKLADWVGLRPGRESIRLEREVIQGRLRPFQVIHNYGHGGSGVTLFWGCAAEAVNLMKQCMDYQSSRTLVAKL